MLAQVENLPVCVHKEGTGLQLLTRHLHFQLKRAPDDACVHAMHLLQTDEMDSGLMLPSQAIIRALP